MSPQATIWYCETCKGHGAWPKDVQASVSASNLARAALEAR